MQIKLRKIIGIGLSLSGAFLMFQGSLLGDRTTGVATVLGIMGIATIATSNNRDGSGNSQGGGEDG
jgi:hypothetical protein